MLFQEKRGDEVWTYTTEDVFGKAVIHSEEKLTGDKLDAIILAIMKHEPSADAVSGTVVISDKHSIEYHLKRAPMWTE